jgi:uncharacterized protein YprB with RNaseH-like and TPR domain
MTTALRDQLSYLQRNRGRAGLPRGRRGTTAGGAQAPAPASAAPTALDVRLAATEQGELLVWEKSISAVWSQAGQVTQSLWAALDGAGAGSPPTAELEPLSRVDPTRVGWVDIETAGFIGRPIFLVGLMRPLDGELVITQLLARDYSQERALLAACAALVAELEVLVTFNGKCFDLPFLRDRMAYHRLAGELEVEAVDLLWAARRRWRGRVPDCRLQTLERHLCRRLRAGDIPGAEIPQRYHDFVRSRDAGLIAPVMRHNRLDLLTMAELSALLLGEP